MPETSIPMPLPAAAYRPRRVFSITVPDYGDDELNRMAVAYEALALQPLRCVEWLEGKIILDHRARTKRKMRALTTPRR